MKNIETEQIMKLFKVYESKILGERIKTGIKLSKKSYEKRQEK